MKEKKEKKKKSGKLYANMIQLILVGSITGIFVGVVVTFFALFAEKGEEFSQNAYAYVRNNPAFIPLLICALFAGAFLLGVALRISTIAKGAGIPQAEGATRGIVRFKWWSDAITMFASSLMSIFLGLSIGSEGPSVLIGGCIGDGVATTLRRNEMVKRYQITGGASTGLAVASNAPLTGIVFAFEEAHKRFTPEVFICSFTSVIFGVLTRAIIYLLLDLPTHSPFHSFVLTQLPLSTYGFVALSGLVCGVFGVVFFKACFGVRRLFKKIKTKSHHKNESVRIFIAVLIGGCLSFIAAGVMGGGHSLIADLGTHGGLDVNRGLGVYGLPIVASLAVVLLLKTLVTTVNVGSGLPCGIFVPIIAIGACLGAILNRWFAVMGLDERYFDVITLICMSAFFATVVRAPLTAVIMVFEFTTVSGSAGSFATLLPVAIGVAIGYFIGEVSRTDGIYEELLKVYERENGIHERAVKELFTFEVASGSIADKREVRDILWPSGARVIEIWRGDEHILPAGDTVLHGGDKLTVLCKTDEPKKARDDLAHIVE